MSLLLLFDLLGELGKFDTVVAACMSTSRVSWLKKMWHNAQRFQPLDTVAVIVEPLLTYVPVFSAIVLPAVS